MKIFNFFKSFWRENNNQPVKMAETNPIQPFKYKTKIDLRFNDFDLLGHVNNATYLTYFEIGRTKYWQQAINWNWKKTGIIIGSASIEYKQPIFPEDTIYIYIRTSRIGIKSFDLEYLIVKEINNKEIICSTGKTSCIAFDYTSNKSVSIPEIERSKMIDFEQLNLEIA